MDEAFARKLDLLQADVWAFGSSATFRRRVGEALDGSLAVHGRLPPPRSVDTLLLELRPGDLHRPGWLADLQRRIRAEGRIWIVLPTRPRAEATGFPHTWDEVRRATLKTDLVDDRAEAFSDGLTAVRLVIRRHLREAHR